MNNHLSKPVNGATKSIFCNNPVTSPIQPDILDPRGDQIRSVPLYKDFCFRCNE